MNSSAIDKSPATLLASIAMLEEEGFSPLISGGRDPLEVREEMMVSYSDIIASIDSPHGFAAAWHDMLSMILLRTDRIMKGMETILARDPGRSPEAKIDESDAGTMDEIAPSIASLRTLFRMSGVFSLNSRMRGTWEEGIVRGNKHHLGNSLFGLANLDRFFESGVMTLGDLRETAEDVWAIFDPIAYVETSYNDQDAGRWLRISSGERGEGALRPANGPRLRRAADEIFYRVGKRANGSPEEVAIEWIDAEGVLSFKSNNGAFSEFARDAGARLLIEEICGEGNVAFIEDGSEIGAHISEIQISAMNMGAEVYTTGTAGLGAAASIVVSGIIF